MTYQALVYDFGGPVLVTPFELVRDLERRLEVPTGTFPWTGPFDPSQDPLWRSMQAEEISEVKYWMYRAEEVATVTGCPGLRPMMAQLYPPDEINSFIRPEACETVRAANATGLQTAVLTNDLALFYDDESISRIKFLDEINVMVDCSRTGVLKPDPAAYQMVLDLLGVPAEAALFIDDQPRNIRGATDIGMPTVFFDVTRPAVCYREVIRLLGLCETGQTQ